MAPQPVSPWAQALRLASLMVLQWAQVLQAWSVLVLQGPPEHDQALMPAFARRIKNTNE